MKRLIALALVLMIISSLPVFVQAEDAVSYTETLLIDYNGDDKSIANGYACDFTNASIEAFDETNGNVIKTTNGGVWLYKGAFREYTSIMELEADYYISELPSKQTVLYYGSYKGSSAKAYLWLEKDGTITTGYNADIKSEEQITLGWINVKVALDVVNRTYDIAVTDAEKTISLFAELPETHTDGTKNYYAYGAQLPKGYTFDNIKLTYKVKNYKVTPEFLGADDTPVSADAVDYENSKIKLTFSEAMNPETVIDENFKLTSALGKDIPFEGEYDAIANTYTITPSEALRPKTEHTITATGLKTALGGNAHYTGDAPADPAATPYELKFTTKKQPFAIGTVEDVGDNSYSVSVVNTSGEGKTAYIVAVSYESGEENGIAYSKITAIDVKPVSAAADGTTEPVTVSTGSADPEIYLMSDDGMFEMLDIWGK